MTYRNITETNVDKLNVMKKSLVGANGTKKNEMKF